MLKIIDLSFFGGSSGSTTTTKEATHGEKSDYLKNMDAAVYNFFQPITEKYGGVTLGSVDGGTGTTSTSNWLNDPNNVMAQGFKTADQTYLTGMNNANDLLSSSNSILNKQIGVTDEAAEAARKTQQQQAADMKRASGYLDNYDDLYSQYKGNNYGQQYLDSADSLLNQAITAGDSDYAQAGRANNSLEDYLKSRGYDATKYTDQLADLTNNANTNQALKNYMSGVYDSISSNLNTKASNALAGAAARGIINSSTSNKAISDLEKNAQNTAAEQFATGFGNLSNNYGTLINAANTNLNNISSAYTNLANSARQLGAQKVSDLQNDANAYNTLYNSYNGNMTNALSNLLSASNQAATNAKLGTESGNQIVNNLLAAASGYDTAYDNNLAGIKANQDAANSAYTTALSPVMAQYQYWRDLNTDRTNQDTEDTVVTQSGGK